MIIEYWVLIIAITFYFNIFAKICYNMYMINILKNRKAKVRIIGFLFVLVLFFSGIKANNWLEWKMAVEAAGTMPYQIGLTNVTMIKCFTIGTPPVCNGGTLCYTKDPATCVNYYDVTGAPAGGMGSNALFSVSQTSMAGLYPGGQLIAGGMSPALMDSGVLASAGGCSGCIAKNTFWDSAKGKFKFIIAGFKIE